MDKREDGMFKSLYANWMLGIRKNISLLCIIICGKEHSEETDRTEKREKE